MDEQVQKKVIEDINALHQSYSNAGFFKKNFQSGTFRKSFQDVLSNYQITEENLFKILSARSVINKNSPPKYISFLSFISGLSSYSTNDTYVMPASPYMFQLLSCILSNEATDAAVVMIFMRAFDTIQKWNRVTTLTASVEPGPLWKKPAIPLLLESLIQLISADKSKVRITGLGNLSGRRCWTVSAENSIKLAQSSLKELEKESYCKNLPIHEFVNNIIERAKIIVDLSEEKAKSFENYLEMPDNNYQPGGWHPWPGYAEIQSANEKKIISFAKELLLYSNQTHTDQIFQAYLSTY
jgi:hypothetical protein